MTGNFKDNCRTEECTFTWANGAVYEGDGKIINVKRVLINGVNGDVYEGDWKDNQP